MAHKCRRTVERNVGTDLIHNFSVMKKKSLVTLFCLEVLLQNNVRKWIQNQHPALKMNCINQTQLFIPEKFCICITSLYTNRRIRNTLERNKFHI